jgi:hypothetical protein
MVAVKGSGLTKVRLQDVAKGQRTVRPNDPLIASARAVGTCFGD